MPSAPGSPTSAHSRERRRITSAKLEHAPDFILLDPPRSGIGKAVVKRLLELKPRAITIVACDPATLARDLSGLGYRIEKMTMVDLFPQTYHIETVVQLKRVSLTQLLHHDIDELVGHGDHLHHLLAVEKRLHLLVRQRLRFQLLFGVPKAA